MATIPAAGHISDSLRTEGEVKADLEAIIASLRQVPGAAAVELAATIAGGSITPAGGGGIIVVDTESAAATDDLANIILTNYPDNACILVRNANAARVVTLKHASTGDGQMFLDRSCDYVLDDTLKYVLLQRRGTDLYEVFRGPSRVSMPVVAKSTNFTVQKEDIGKVFVCTNAITVSFAAAAQLGNGFFCTIINHNYNSLNSVYLDPSGSETIDGAATTQVILNSGSGKLVVGDGSKLYSLNDYVVPNRVSVAFASSLNVNATSGNYFEVGALTANITSFTLTGFEVGKRIRFRFVQDATGGRTVALPGGAKVTGSLGSTANQASWLDLTFTQAGNRIEGFWTQIPL